MHDPVTRPPIPAEHPDAPFTFAPPPDPRLAERPPRCLRCAYILEKLTQPRCPECGLPFNPLMADTFTRAPSLVRWKYWLPGFLTAGALGGAAYMLFLANGIVGWGLTLGAPLAIGAVLGYGTRATVIVRVLLTVAVVVFAVTCALMSNVAGALCGTILAVLFLVPAFLGVAVGSVIRGVIKDTSFSQRWHLPVVFLLLTPAALHVVERGVELRHEPETVTTSRVLPVPLAAAWHADLFSAGPAEDRPASMRIGLPQPQRVTGGTRVGDVKTARFSKGTLTVRVEEREEYLRLGYQFIGQTKVEDNAVKLLDGAFDYERSGAGATRVTVSTRYQPLMTPRWCWRTFEHQAGHSMHSHLLDELERAARLAPSTQPAP